MLTISLHHRHNGALPSSEAPPFPLADPLPPPRIPQEPHVVTAEYFAEHPPGYEPRGLTHEDFVKHGQHLGDFIDF